MKVSLVIPTHNKVGLLRRTLDSLGGQRTDGGFEAVVVDDGSTDGTGAFLESFRPGYPLIPVAGERNRGRAAARNRGLARVTGDLVVFLDDDMELDPGFLEAHRAFHAARSRAAGVGNVVNHPEVTRAPIDRYMSTRGAQKIRDRAPLPWKYFTTNNSSVRREDLEAVGGFDEGFVTYGFEDLELAWRLERERGLSFHFVPEARSHHIHPHSLEDVLEKKTLCGRSSLSYLFRKHPETRRALGYHRFDPPRLEDPLALNLTRLLYRTLLTRPVYTLVKPLARLPLGPVTFRVLDYLVQYHYLEGMKHPLPSPGEGSA